MTSTADSAAAGSAVTTARWTIAGADASTAASALLLARPLLLWLLASLPRWELPRGVTAGESRSSSAYVRNIIARAVRGSSSSSGSSAPTALA